jgi:hypothetical protein
MNPSVAMIVDLPGAGIEVVARERGVVFPRCVLVAVKRLQSRSNLLKEDLFIAGNALPG